MLASIIYNYGKFCDDFKSTLKLGAYVKKDIGDIRQEKIDMCDIHAVGKMAGKLSAERDTFMKEKEEYLESIQSKLRKLLFEEIALEDARKMYN